MSTASAMSQSYSMDSGAVDVRTLSECIDVLVECARTCTMCADACLGEELVAHLTTCVRTNADCADICFVAAKVLSRPTGHSAELKRHLLETCVIACDRCADECRKHSLRHHHCQVCAEACRRCSAICRELAEALQG